MRLKTHAASCAAAAALCAVPGNDARGGVRDVQIVEVDTGSAVVTLSNCGDAAQSLEGFQFCTQNDSQILRYTSGAGFSGVSLDPGDELRVHWNNDAPGDDPDAINVSSLGGLSAQPLDSGPFGLSLYWTTPFSIGANLADHVMWTDSLDSSGNLTADERADEAVAGGVWTAVDAWVVTDGAPVVLQLTDETCSELHGPADYEATAPPDCPFDFDGDGMVGSNDLASLLGAWGDPFGSDDLAALLGGWGPCP